MTDRELSKTYDSAQVEGPTYSLWLERKAFCASPDDRPRDHRYIIMMPLPNVTGALHMGHAMDNVMQDLLIRWHRMQGDNTLWMPGTDHAGIATQAVVEKRLKELEGLTRHDLGRDGLVDRIWLWKDQYQARIISQQQRMGCSCDWDRQRFTMDAVCARAVRHSFFRMFSDGLIYRGRRLVNWDVFLQTSVSDDEVYHEKVQGHFWHLCYPVIEPQKGEPQTVTVATTRPETMLGDTAVAVHPDPERALTDRAQKLKQAIDAASPKERSALEEELKELRDRQIILLPQLIKLRDMAQAGRQVILPLLSRPIPLICDEWAKPELGSGCVKITPAHDPNDYEVWTRHREEIDIVNILNPDGTLNQAAGPYVGQDRFEARKHVVADLEAQGLLEKVEEREVEIGHSDRSKTPVEPYLSDQWFVRMGDVSGGVVLGRGTANEHKAPGLVQAAMDAATQGRVKIHPERYTKTYLDWLAEKRDWPISRQLWWGHQIPVWAKRTSFINADLNVLLPFVGSKMAVRVHLPEQERNILFIGQKDLADDVRDDESCIVDICLLEDDSALIKKLGDLGYERDLDVLDTWFSSALWPFSTLGWPDPITAQIEEGQPSLGSIQEGEDCLSYYYPGSCLVTARDIITLWVARMVLAGLYNLGDIPFSDVFIHANILDGKGERMSKSKGNGIDPVDIIDRYGTDAMRYVLCDMQTGTQDIRLPVTAICPRCDHHNDLADTAHGKSVFSYLCGKDSNGKSRKDSCGGEFDVLGTIPDLPAARLISERFEVGRQFCTKLWNSARFAFMNLVQVPTVPRSKDDLTVEDRWILDSLNQAIAATDRGLAKYNPSEALNAARSFFWGELCDWYLELIKARLQDEKDPTGPVARQVLAYCLDQVLRLLHPFVPYITEHLWQKLREQVPERGLGELASAEKSDLLIMAAWPQKNPRLEDAALRATFVDLQNITRAIREVRASTGTSPRQPLEVTLKVPDEKVEAIKSEAHVIERLALVKLKIDPNASSVPGSAVKVVDQVEIFVHGVIDDAAERTRLEKQLVKVEKEIVVCEKKLSNPRFTDQAPPAVVQEERDRLAVYEQNKAAILRSIEQLG
ncbi:MAG: valine--tRNA ligase [Pseudomonadota bacterium]